MPIDYLDPQRTGDLNYRRGLRTAALDRELQYDMPSYGGNLAKMQARGLQYGRDRNRMNSELDSEGLDPLYSLNAQSAQMVRDTPRSFSAPRGGGSGVDEAFQGGWNFNFPAPRQPSYDALEFADRAAGRAQALSRSGFRAPSSPQADFLSPRATVGRRGGWQDAADDGPTDADRVALQERTYQGALARNDPVALARREAIGRDALSERIRLGNPVDVYRSA